MRMTQSPADRPSVGAGPIQRGGTIAWSGAKPAAAPAPQEAPAKSGDGGESFGFAQILTFPIWLGLFVVAWNYASKEYGRPDFFPGPAATIAGWSSLPVQRGIEFTVEHLTYGAFGAGAGLFLGALAGGITRGSRFLEPPFAIVSAIPLMLFAPLILVYAGMAGQMRMVVLIVAGAAAFAHFGFRIGHGLGVTGDAWRGGVRNVFMLEVVLEWFTATNGLGSTLMRAVNQFDMRTALSAALAVLVLYGIACMPGIFLRQR
jgi:ABC-type nitrate/sulfonate/bicarbonate transport system permease component